MVYKRGYFMIGAIHSVWQRMTGRFIEHAESGQFVTRSQEFRILASLHKTRQVLLSIPHYFTELARIRRPGELYTWAYFKCPNLFPLTEFPTYVTVELTNSCNLSCKHCWRAAMDRPEGFMEVALFEKIVRELSLRRPALFKIGGAGEPAIHPRFRELMTLLAPYALRVAVYTNGSLLRLFPHREILSWGLDRIVISVDGLDACSYEQIKIGSNYSSLRKPIVDFLKCRKSSGGRTPIIEIRHILMPNETIIQVSKFRKMWLKTADTVMFNCLWPANELSQFEDPSPPKCRSIRRERCIHWDGNVPICGGPLSNDYYGNVRHRTIDELWRHPRLEHLQQCNERRDFAQVPRCKRCLHCR